MTEAEISKTLTEYHNRIFHDKETYGIADIPIEKAVRLGLPEDVFQAYLNIYVELFPDRFKIAIINNDLINRDVIRFLTAYPYHIKDIPLYLYIHNKNDLLGLISRNPGLFEIDMLPTFLSGDSDFKNTVRIANLSVKKYEPTTDFKYVDSEWKDKNANLIRLFEIDGTFPFKTKKDYCDLVEEYYDSKMSINVFCAKHRISDEKNFRKLVKQVKEEGAIKEPSRKHLVEEQRILGEHFLSGELTLERYLKYFYNPRHTISRFCFALGPKADEFSNILANQLYKYILKSIKNVDVEKLSTLFDIEFSYTMIADSYSPDPTELGSRIKSFIDVYSTKRGSDVNVPIKSYSSQYRNKSLNGTLIHDGVSYEIDDDVIEDVLDYMRDNEIFISQKSVNYYAKQIATGKIKPRNKTNKAKK